MSQNEAGDIVCDICHQVKTGPIVMLADADLCMDCFIADYTRQQDRIAELEAQLAAQREQIERLLAEAAHS